MTSAKILLQQELLDHRSRAIDLNNLLTVDYGRGTIAVVHQALGDKRIDPNRLMATILSYQGDKYHGPLLGMALRAGANPNIYINNSYHVFLLAIWNIKNQDVLQDYYFIMLVKGMNLDARVSPSNVKSINLNGAVTSPKTSLGKYLIAVGKNYGTISHMASTNPRMSSRIGIMTAANTVIISKGVVTIISTTPSSNGIRLIIPNQYEAKDVIGNHLPVVFTPPDTRIAWVSYNLYASVVFMNYNTFVVALAREPEVMYTTANDILLSMNKVGIENVYLIKIYNDMLRDLGTRGYNLDGWQSAMLNKLTRKSVPDCANVAEEFPLDFNKLVMGLDGEQRRTLNNVCEYNVRTIQGSNVGEADPLKCADPSSTVYYEGGKKYCFNHSQVSGLIRTGLNPETGKQLDSSFISRLRNRAGATTVELDQDPIINRFIYHAGVTLDDKSPDQLEAIVRSVFGTGNLRLLEPGHARVTAAWIGNWAYANDVSKFELYRRQLGYHPSNVIGSESNPTLGLQQQSVRPQLQQPLNPALQQQFVRPQLQQAQNPLLNQPLNPALQQPLNQPLNPQLQQASNPLLNQPLNPALNPPPVRGIPGQQVTTAQFRM